MLVAEITEPYIGPAEHGPRAAAPARLLITHPLAELRVLRRNLDRWFLAALALSTVTALIVSTWIANALSRPLSELAEQTARLDLDRLDVDFATSRDDEIGALSRLLRAMTRRLRASAATLREAERRAAVGDLARQVNHDIKNGLAPIRNVLRHLTQVQQEHPEQLAQIFAERRPTLDASIAYLDTLARNYARLTPRLDLRACDPNTIAREVAATARAGTDDVLRLRLDDRVPAVAADPVVLRRVLDNLVSNAIDSLDGGSGTVTIGTLATQDGVRITVADTGRGMTREQLARAVDDFYTTKPHGTGLGLSIVRRLVADLHGAMRIDTEPGAGTTVTITIPASPTARRSLAAPPTTHPSRS
jgi:signal transduction histidine kinase